MAGSSPPNRTRARRGSILREEVRRRCEPTGRGREGDTCDGGGARRPSGSDSAASGSYSRSGRSDSTASDTESRSDRGRSRSKKLMSKRLQGQEKQAKCACKRPRPELEQKHLYLVLDDWKDGFSIHKIDAADDDAELGQPPVLRLLSPEPGFPMRFAVLGSSIVIVTNPYCGQAPTLVYDTKITGLAIGPPLPRPLIGDFHTSVATADMLYVLSFRQLNQQHSFEVMSWTPTANEDSWSQVLVP